MPEPFTPADFCVVAAVDNDHIAQHCLRRSPDIAAGALPLVEIHGATSMARAYNQGLEQTQAAIVLFAHQDVYFPRGWLDRAAALLTELTREQPDWMVAGLYGVTADGGHVGRIWDVTLGGEIGQKDFAPTPVESLDELVLILWRDPAFRFDEGLPHFHLYGTDLVQSAWAMGRSAWAVELPVVHNNRPVASLAGGYTLAYNYARRKWRHRLPIQTTVCALTFNPLPLWRVKFRRRNIKGRGALLRADALAVARQAGYE